MHTAVLLAQLLNTPNMACLHNIALQIDVCFVFMLESGTKVALKMHLKFSKTFSSNLNAW